PYLAYQDRGEPLSERMTAEGPDGPIALPPDMMVEGEPVMNISKEAKVQIALAAGERPGHLDEGATAAGQLAAMDRDGIDAALILPTYASFLTAMDHCDASLSAAFALAYNRWLADMCAADPSRLHGAALIAKHDPETMVGQAKFAVDRGWKAVALRPNPVRGRLLGDPANAPFWAFCADNGLSVIVHEGAHARTTSAGADRFTSRFALHACSHVMEQMMALLSLLEGGVMERHPGLRFGFLEAGCGWMVNWLWRLDEVEYAHLAGEVASTIRQKPSAYFRRQCVIGIEPDEPLLAETLNYLGPRHLMFGSDFPHVDHAADIVGEAVRLPLERNLLARVLWDNAAEFLGIG
ncbi:MAG: amidohydrolase family protein, partial [Pseudomonadota bacterium]